MEEDKEIISEIDKRSQEERIHDFSELLNKITGIDDKKKQLWLEIYQNAVTDRQNSFVMFIKLVRITNDQSTEHAVHGRTMATYLERMSRANDQLIKLADLVARNDSPQGFSTEELFDKIRHKSNK